RVAAVKHAAAQGDAELVGDDGAAQVEIRLAGVAGVTILLEPGFQPDRTAPFLRHLAGDDVHDATHGIGPVQRGHRAADHFDALDGREGRDEAGRGVAETVGRDVARRVLTATVDQNQRVFAGHAADADVQIARLAGCAAYVDALDVAKCVGQIDERFLFKVFTRHYRDRGRRRLDFLFETRCRYHDRVELLHVVVGVCGQRTKNQ